MGVLDPVGAVMQDKTLVENNNYRSRHQTGIIFLEVDFDIAKL